MLRDNAHYHLSRMPHGNSSSTLHWRILLDEMSLGNGLVSMSATEYRWQFHRRADNNACNVQRHSFGISPKISFRDKSVRARDMYRSRLSALAAGDPTASLYPPILDIKTNFRIYDLSTFSNIRYIC